MKDLALAHQTFLVRQASQAAQVVLAVQLDPKAKKIGESVVGALCCQMLLQLEALWPDIQRRAKGALVMSALTCITILARCPYVRALGWCLFGFYRFSRNTGAPLVPSW